MKTEMHSQLKNLPGTIRISARDGGRAQHSHPMKSRLVSEQSTCLAHMALRQFLLDMVALVYEVELSQLLAPTRGRKKTAFARQVAMYLAHTGGGLSLTVVGRLFKRDRTTVAHACALVEDARDNDVLDRSLEHLESAIACQMQLFRLSETTDAVGKASGNGSRYEN